MILLPFAAVVTAILSVHTFWSQQTLHRVADASALEVNRQVAARVEARLDALFDAPGQLLDTTAGAIELGLVGFEDAARLERSLVNEVRAHPWVTNLAVGLDDGRYACAYRPWDEATRVMVSVADGGGVISSFDVAPDGTRTDLFSAREGFEVTERPWYAAAIDRAGPSWYQPYEVFSGMGVAIGLSRAVRTPDGSRGVVAVDIALDEIGAFLASLDLAADGVAFVMTPDGRMIADSSGRAPIERPAASEAAGPATTASAEAPRQRVPASRSPLDGIRRVESRVREAGGTFQGAIGSGADADIVHADRYARDGGLELIIGVSVPRSSYGDALAAESRRGLFIAIAVGLMGLALLAVLARGITRPVRELTAAISDTEADRFPNYVPDSSIREIDTLARSFSTMSNRLGGVMASLEQRVAERTGALEAANRQLQQQNRTDELTGLANRRRFARELAREWQRASRRGHPLSLVMCDIDWFKTFNDDYGHPAGDRALVDVGTALKGRARRSGDLVARIGGEEFVFLLPDVDLEAARALSERAREDIERLGIEHRGSPFGIVTVSFGVTSIVPDATQPGADSTQLIAAADRALYRAKRLGRNRVECESESESGSRPEAEPTEPA
ncbi:diguanylate cyclase domain-containing protein [Halomonas denitrificans]|nr:diguanylate cyclase [Halomonas denitrificans]